MQQQAKSEHQQDLKRRSSAQTRQAVDSIHKQQFSQWHHKQNHHSHQRQGSAADENIAMSSQAACSTLGISQQAHSDEIRCVKQPNHEEKVQAVGFVKKCMHLNLCNSVLYVLHGNCYDKYFIWIHRM